MRFKGPCAEVAARVLGAVHDYTVRILRTRGSAGVSANNQRVREELAGPVTVFHNNQILYQNWVAQSAAVSSPAFCN
jgi:hypothetical protein